jgi:membrane fusion protein (multidrug efflux system)
MRMIMRFLAVALAALSLLAAGSDSRAQAPAGPQAIPVEVQTVGTAPIVDTLRAVGTLRADQSIIVRSEVPGVIVKIGFVESLPVTRGQVLIKLDDTIARAEVQQAEAALNLAQRNYDRASELARTGAGAARARDEAQAAFENTRAALALARARLEKTTINAPFAGLAGLRKVDLGAYITVGQDLVSLDAVDIVMADFTVPERYLRFLAPDNRIQIEADALPGQSFDGKITALNPRIDPDGRSLAVRAQVPNPSGILKPGMFVRVAIVVAQRENAIVIPEQAIVPSGDQITVYRIVDGKSVQTPIKLGLRSFGKVEVVEGLKEGETIVTAGQLKVQDGSPVRILPPAAAGG